MLTTILSILAALGGFEAVKYLLNLRTNTRLAATQADSADFTLMRETIEFLQQQLRQQVEADAAKEKRFTEQTERLRATQDREHKLQAENASLALELQRYRCVVAKCPNREPQNGY